MINRCLRKKSLGKNSSLFNLSLLIILAGVKIGGKWLLAGYKQVLAFPAQKELSRAAIKFFQDGIPAFGCHKKALHWTEIKFYSDTFPGFHATILVLIIWRKGAYRHDDRGYLELSWSKFSNIPNDALRCFSKEKCIKNGLKFYGFTFRYQWG